MNSVVLVGCNIITSIICCVGLALVLAVIAIINVILTMRSSQISDGQQTIGGKTQ